MRKILPLAVFVTLTGCATHRFDLVYETSVHSSGGEGEFYLAKPLETHESKKDKQGRWILGHNPYAGGGDLVTDGDIGNWIATALSQELAEAGYTVKPVTALPEDVQKGLEVTISHISVRHEATGWGSAAPSKLNLKFVVYSRGAQAISFSVDAKGDYSKSSWNMARQKALSLQKALQVAMEQAVPEIVRTLEGAGGRQRR